MNDSLQLLPPLLIGLCLGAFLSFLVMRAKISALRTLLNERESMAHQVSALAAQAARDSSAQLFELAQTQRQGEQDRFAQQSEKQQQVLQETVAPVAEVLQQLQSQLLRSHDARLKAETEMREQVHMLARQSNQLAQETSHLAGALNNANTRGRWGELQLRRIVELSGLLPHCDFIEQDQTVSINGDNNIRPDLVIHLTHDRRIVVDAKVPMTAFAQLAASITPANANELKAQHARQLREHIKVLAKKAYWDSYVDCPEFVVLFLPADGILQAAAEADPNIFETAFSQNVVLATPSTLMALLRTVGHTWRNDAVEKQSREIIELGAQLNTRLNTFIEHLNKVGRSLNTSVTTYNQAIGSLRSRVLVTSRRFSELQQSSAKPVEVNEVETRALHSESDTV